MAPALDEGKMIKKKTKTKHTVLWHLLCLAGEWMGHHWQDPGGACSYAEEHKARGNCLSDRGSSGGGLSTSRAGKLFFPSRVVLKGSPVF